jgi:hypothetical protein
MLKSRSFLILAGTASSVLFFATAASATNSPTYTQIGRNITVNAGEVASDVTCVACSIRIRGQVSGDVTAVGGSVYVEDAGQIAGDVTVVAGSVRLEQEVKVSGDTTVVGGELFRAPGAQTGGDVTTVGGRFWGPVFLVIPFLLIGGIVTLLIWLVQRSRRPTVSAATSQARV